MNVLEPHVSLDVSSIESSVAFYEKAFDDRHEAPTGLCEVEDPDGSMWEAFAVKSDAEAMHDDASSTAAACCAPAAGLPDKPVQLEKKSRCC